MPLSKKVITRLETSSATELLKLEKHCSGRLQRLAESFTCLKTFTLVNRIIEIQKHRDSLLGNIFL